MTFDDVTGILIAVLPSAHLIYGLIRRGDVAANFFDCAGMAVHADQRKPTCYCLCATAHFRVR